MQMYGKDNSITNNSPQSTRSFTEFFRFALNFHFSDRVLNNSSSSLRYVLNDKMRKYNNPPCEGGRGMFHRTCHDGAEAMRMLHPPTPLHKGDGIVLYLKLPNRSTLSWSNVQRIVFGDTECFVPCIDVWQSTVHTPTTE